MMHNEHDIDGWGAGGPSWRDLMMNQQCRSRKRDGRKKSGIPGWLIFSVTVRDAPWLKTGC